MIALQSDFEINLISTYPVSRVGLQKSPSSTSPTFYISISRSCKPVFSSETDRQEKNIEERGE